MGSDDPFDPSFDPRSYTLEQSFYNQCGSSTNDPHFVVQFECTRTKDHDGPHVAHGFRGKPVCAWIGGRIRVIL